MRSEHQKRVDHFMKLAGQELPEKPILPPEEIRLLRARLILEETLETLEALGFGLYLKAQPSLPDNGYLGPLSKHIEIKPISSPTPSLVKIADGCADIKVVVTGTLSACGMEDEELQKMVDENNLAKFGPGGYRREDGKWVKPPNHRPPDIEGLLEKQGWEK